MSDSKSTAIGIIRAEHRTLAAVINNMRDLFQRSRDEQIPIDFPLFWSMIYYIEVFPDLQHHPKEDDWLFARLRQRTDKAHTLIDQLEAEHRAEPQALAELRRRLGHLEVGIDGSAEAFEHALSTYADFVWKHLRTEEQELLPLAQTYLQPEDWDDIANAFSGNQDPLTKAQTDSLHDRFRAILSRTPAPFGLGSA